jgi:hemolysin activation/secretion protein
LISRGKLFCTTVAVAAGAAALGVGTLAQAQSAVAPPSREQLNPAARVAPPPASRPGDVFAPEPPGPCPLANSPAKFTLKSVTFSGQPVLRADELAPSYAEMVGKEVPVSAICEVRDRASRILFDHGVLARVKIPPQTIADGTLTLEVLAAHVVNVRVRGDAGHAQAAVERYLGKLRGLNPFNMRVAERYLLLANDVPGARVRAALRPSTNGEAGAVDLDVTVSVKTVDVVANIQNLESDVIGPWGGLARIDVQDLTDFGERTSVIGYHTLDSNEQWVAQLIEEARLGSDGLVARGSAVYGETRPGGAVKPLDLLSRSLVGEVELAYPIVRMRRRNLNATLGLDVIDQSTDISGFRLFEDDLRVFYARLDGDDRVDLMSRQVQLSGSLGVRKGVEGLGASSQESVMLSRPGALPDGWALRGSFRASAMVVDKLQATLQVQGQYARDPLLSYEQFALGDLTVGRGYNPAVVLGDSGVGGSFQLAYGPLPVHRLALAQPYVFYDAGYVTQNGLALTPNRTLTSAGAGVVLRLANRANLDLAYAVPFRAPYPGQSQPPPRILVNLTVGVF